MANKYFIFQCFEIALILSYKIDYNSSIYIIEIS